MFVKRDSPGNLNSFKLILSGEEENVHKESKSVVFKVPTMWRLPCMT